MIDHINAVLSSLKYNIQKNNTLIPIPINTMLYLTKEEPGVSYGHFIRDIYLEEVVKADIFKMNFLSIIERYRRFDPQFNSYDIPAHYAIRTNMMKGKVAQGDNIFMFFPHALGIQETNDPSDYFGFEFIDIWSRIFLDIILPCANIVFTPQINDRINKTLTNIEYISFFASIFHELGHRVGPWKISPSFDQDIKINEFQFNILGELATDSLTIANLFDIEHACLFILLQRLFWFGRRGFKYNNISAEMNTDNDCWIGSYLWNKLTHYKCLYQSRGGKYDINFSRITILFESIISEIDHIAQMLKKSDGAMHQYIVDTWMKQHVTYINDSKYVLPKSYRNILFECDHIIYNIHDRAVDY